MKRLKWFFIDEEGLKPGLRIATPPTLQNRLSKVLRLKASEAIALFNGKEGLFSAELLDDKAKVLVIKEHLRQQPSRAQKTLLIGIPKREAWEQVLRQATELGVTQIIPLNTDFSQISKLNPEKNRAHLIEACEQSEQLALPALSSVQPLKVAINQLKETCAWAYERLESEQVKPQSSFNAILVGPEGGFSEEEIAFLSNQSKVCPVSLGNTILRTDTAVVAALAKFL